MNHVAGVDISGTFTDCVVMDEAGRINPHDRANMDGYRNIRIYVGGA
jgi:predicted NBD/HSP70 family sugar kinase